MKSMFAQMNLVSWCIVLLLAHFRVVNSFQSSYVGFIGCGNWMKVAANRVQRIPAISRKETMIKCASCPIPIQIAAVDDTAEEIAQNTDEPAPVEDNHVWTPELDALLLKRLGLMKKRLRWYKVAKLLGGTATARNCFARYEELTAVVEPPYVRAARAKADDLSNRWTELEISCLTTSVERNINEENGQVNWERVGIEMNLEAYVCEKKYAMVAAQRAEEAELKAAAENELLSEGEDFWSTSSSFDDEELNEE